MKRLADDFAEIRARRDELAREHDAAIRGGAADWEGCEVSVSDLAEVTAVAEVTTADLLRAVFEGEGDPLPAEDQALAIALQIARNSGAELALGSDRCWRGVVNGYPIGPFPEKELSRALAAYRALREWNRPR